MRNERRAILALMAAGRISAVEAERLLRVWNERFEALWIAALCLLACLAQLHLPALADAAGRLSHELAPEGTRIWQTAGSLLMKGIGGTI